MRRRLALSILLTALISTFGAGLTVVSAWAGMPGAPNAVSPAMWAARAYLMYFDLWALATFVPSLMLCRWLSTRPDFIRRALAAPSPAIRPEAELPFQEAL